MNSIKVIAPCKVNLFLEVVGTDKNNYHLLNTVMQSTSLADTVIITPRGDKEITVKVSDLSIPENEENIAYKAASAIIAEIDIKHGFSIEIDKQIPAEAGLGGGSTNAAAVLMGINHMYGGTVSAERLSAIGKGIGADVPFCLVGGSGLAQGIGEVITPMSSLLRCYLVIAKPDSGVSTAEAFGLYDKLVPDNRGNLESLKTAWQEGNLGCIGKSLYNVFQQVIDDKHTEIITETMKKCGSIGSVLSGTGSAVVGLFDSEKSAKDAYIALSKKYNQVYQAVPIYKGVHISE